MKMNISSSINKSTTLIIVLHSKMTHKKRGQITSSTFRRHRQTPNVLQRVNAHAIRREQSTSVLVHFIEIWRISETRIKSGCSKSFISFQ